VIRLPRPAVSIAVAVALTTLSAACSSSHAGTAATVGSDRITTKALSDRVDAALAAPGVKAQVGTDRAKFERQVLTLMIDHQLIRDAASTNRVSVSDGAITTRYQTFVKQAGSETELVKQGAAAGIPKAELKPYFGDLLLTESIGAKLTASSVLSTAALQQAYQQSFVQVHSAHILVKDQATAEKLLAQVKANPSSFAALAKKNSIDTGSKKTGGDLGTQAPSKFVGPFATAVATAKVGSYVVIKTQFGYHVIHVISRKATKTLAQATPELRTQLLASRRQAAIGQLLSKESKDKKVTVNPRFGTWDATKGSVEPAPDTLSSPGKGSTSGSPAPSSSGG